MLFLEDWKVIGKVVRICHPFSNPETKGQDVCFYARSGQTAKDVFSCYL